MMPHIDKYMTPMPHSVGLHQPLKTAHDIMHTHAIRHLPVLEGGRLVGIVTSRDLALVESLEDVDPSKVEVEEAMTTDVYAVTPDARLDEVANEMAERKYGCAVVIEAAKVVGVFTTVDACRALVEVLHARKK